ncbi:MAG TPA: FAD-dependent oxidoreductase [Pseudolabrys sp.]|nr:FAD-dependent oxidoreductase [Pseudolabrys sp.]
MSSASIKTTCCIAGGGPAGMMLGFLLARAGIPVVVLEKHKDFLRDFRGDTVHPSTLQMMHELGLLDEFLKLPHSKVDHVQMQIGADTVRIALVGLPTVCKYIAFMPQWDFLNFLAAKGKKYPGFDLRMRAEATELIEDNGRVIGLRAKTGEGELEIRADLVVGCDGRHSTLRDKAGFKSDDLGAPMDVMWFRISRKDSDWDEIVGHIERGRMMVMLDRDDYWQCAFVIPKDSIDKVKARGLDDFRKVVAEMAPFDVSGRLGEVKSWDDVKLLTVAVDTLRRWYRPGLICIGDAAHAMSPIGGVGINLAVQDAVASANILAEPLRRGTMTDATLAAIQKRRQFPTKVTQRLQLLLQNNLIGPALQGTGPRPKAPLVMKMLQWPLLNRIPARAIALGIRPEHIKTPEAPL